MSANKQVYFTIDKDGDVQYFEDEDKFNNYYKVKTDVQVFVGTKVEVELVPAQVVVKGSTTKKTAGKRGPRPRDPGTSRPLTADGQPFAPRGSKKDAATTSPN